MGCWCEGMCDTQDTIITLQDDDIGNFHKHINRRDFAIQFTEQNIFKIDLFDTSGGSDDSPRGRDKAGKDVA